MAGPSDLRWLSSDHVRFGSLEFVIGAQPSMPEMLQSLFLVIDTDISVELEEQYPKVMKEGHDERRGAAGRPAGGGPLGDAPASVPNRGGATRSLPRRPPRDTPNTVGEARYLVPVCQHHLPAPRAKRPPRVRRAWRKGTRTRSATPTLRRHTPTQCGGRWGLSPRAQRANLGRASLRRSSSGPSNRTTTSTHTRASPSPTSTPRAWGRGRDATRSGSASWSMGPKRLQMGQGRRISMTGDPT